jgi:hypothetical protein
VLASIPDAHTLHTASVATACGLNLVYEMRDDWEAFSSVDQASWYSAELESKIICSADAITTVSQQLRSKAWVLGSQVNPATVIPNGVEESYVHRTMGERRSRLHTMLGSREKKNLRVGYFGHLTKQWFDWVALYHAAEQYPQWEFVLIGFGYTESDVRNAPPNVSISGPIAREHLPDIARDWDVAVIPFIPGRLACGVDPIKAYEYLALGLPVASCTMPSLDRFPFTVQYPDPASMPEAIREAHSRLLCSLNDPQSAISQIEGFLERNTWESRAQSLMALVRERVFS